MKEFYALKTIATIFKILGIINIIISVALLLFALLVPDYSLFSQFSIIRGGDIFAALIFLLLSLLPALIFFAFSEIILLFLQIEKNTRKDNNIETTINTTQNNNSNTNTDFQEWKKNNPNKTLNEYYQSKRQ